MDDTKKAGEKVQGFWVIEIQELAGMRKADIEKVKAFISSTDDKYRASYGHHVEWHPRQCIIFATVNGEQGYLRDLTGNRRFWVIKINSTNVIPNFGFDNKEPRILPAQGADENQWLARIFNNPPRPIAIPAYIPYKATSICFFISSC